jgi:DNA-binding transcriptional MerR regulator
MGLVKSSREESSGYRLYDETALSRLRQILILRKMNISIEDIGKIFAAKNSDSVLSVLDKCGNRNGGFKPRTAGNIAVQRKSVGIQGKNGGLEP